MTEAYFVETDRGLEPRPHAHGPWADMLHGRLLGGLAARALEVELGADGWRAGRLTVDLFRPAAMSVVTSSVTTLRLGRKVRVAEATLTCAGHAVVRASALFLATGTEPPGNIWRPDHQPWPDPETVVPTERDQAADAEQRGWIFRTVTGGMGTGERSRVWTNDTLPLVDGEPMSPLVRAAVSADIGCPLTNSSDAGLFYINADYSLMLGRYPVGPWIGIEATEQCQADGISAAAATLVDRDGVFAMSSGSSLSRPPLHHE